MNTHIYLQQINEIPRLTHADEISLSQAIQNGLLARQRLEDADVNKEELERIIHEGNQAQKILVEANLRLVTFVAKNYHNVEGMDFLDIIQEGNIGLIKAAEKYDPKMGIAFSTCAVWRIRQAIWEGILNRGRLLQLPYKTKVSESKIKSAINELMQENEATPCLEQIAQHLDMPLCEVIDTYRVSQGIISMDAPITPDSECKIGDLIVNFECEEETASLNSQWLETEVQKALDGLKEREAYILSCFYGYKMPKQSLAEIGRELNISRERVRQIKDVAVKKFTDSYLHPQQ